jgi:hypothetical protein
MVWSGTKIQGWFKKKIRVWVPKLQGENEEGGGKNFVNSKTKLWYSSVINWKIIKV